MRSRGQDWLVDQLKRDGVVAHSDGAGAALNLALPPATCAAPSHLTLAHTPAAASLHPTDPSTQLTLPHLLLPPPPPQLYDPLAHLPPVERALRQTDRAHYVDSGIPLAYIYQAGGLLCCAVLFCALHCFAAAAAAAAAAALCCSCAAPAAAVKCLPPAHNPQPCWPDSQQFGVLLPCMPTTTHCIAAACCRRRHRLPRSGAAPAQCGAPWRPPHPRRQGGSGEVSRRAAQHAQQLLQQGQAQPSSLTQPRRQALPVIGGGGHISLPPPPIPMFPP